MLRYARLEVLRQLRNRQAIVFRIALPGALFLFFRMVLVEDVPRPGVHPDADAMVAFAVLGILFSGLFAAGPPLAQERAGGWLRQLSVTPLPAGAAIAGKVAAAMAFALPSVGLVLAAAAISQNVGLGLGRWLELLVLLWAATIPFAALGVLIGLAVSDAEAAQSFASLAFIALWALGGMITEPSDLPGTLEAVAHTLPTNGAAELGWASVRGDALPFGAVAVIVAWTAGAALLARMAWRNIGLGA